MKQAGDPDPPSHFSPIALTFAGSGGCVAASGRPTTPIRIGGDMYTVKGLSQDGREARFACGTDEQAMEKTWELARRGFRDVTVTDPRGKEWTAAAFERSLDIDWD